MTNDLILTIKANAKQFLSTIDSVKSSMLGVKKSIGDIDEENKKVKKSFSDSFKVGAITGAAISAFQTLTSTITSSVGSAVKRVDTLNNSTRIFENMGFAANDTKETMKELEKSIKGLPTSLDSAVQGVQNIASVTGDISKSQKIFEALNNAIIGFGGSSYDVQNAIGQLTQLPMDGPLDAQTWNSLRNSGLMPVISAIAKDMGISVNELKEKFSEGQLTVGDFTDKLVKMNTEGGGGLKSLKQIAKDSTAGIGTGFENAQTAVVRGVGKIIQSIGSENISNAISNVGKVLEDTLNGISGIIKFISDNSTIFSTIAVAIGSIVAALITYNAVMGTVNAVTALFNVIMSANPIALVVLAIIGLIAAFIQLWNNVEGFRNFFVGVWNGIIGFLGGVWNSITGIFGGVAGWFGGIFQGAWNAITGVFGRLGGFFGGVWNNIVGMFGSLGSFVGNAIGGAVKGAVNGALSMVENMANGFIGMINGAIGLINKIPGVNIGHIARLSIPRLATGGIVGPQNGGSIIYAGDGGQNEWVVPESKMASLVSQINRRLDGTGGGVTKNITVNNTYNVRDRVDSQMVASDLGYLLSQA